MDCLSFEYTRRSQALVSSTSTQSMVNIIIIWYCVIRCPYCIPPFAIQIILTIAKCRKFEVLLAHQILFFALRLISHIGLSATLCVTSPLAKYQLCNRQRNQQSQHNSEMLTSQRHLLSLSIFGKILWETPGKVTLQPQRLRKHGETQSIDHYKMG